MQFNRRLTFVAHSAMTMQDGSVLHKVEAIDMDTKTTVTFYLSDRSPCVATAMDRIFGDIIDCTFSLRPRKGGGYSLSCQAMSIGK